MYYFLSPSFTTGGSSEQQLLILWVNWVNSVFIGLRVTQSLLFWVLFCRSLAVLLSFFFWPLCCLSFFALRLLITPFRIFKLFHETCMVFNVTFNNISVVSWQSFLLVVETGVPRENNRPATSHRQTLSHNFVSMIPRHELYSNSQL